MGVSAIPAGYHTITPYLVVQGAAEALAFYKAAFGAVEVVRMEGPDGGIMHAEFQVGDSRVMLSNECPSGQYPGPKALGGTPVSLLLYVEDADAWFAKAVEAGATAREAVKEQPWGDRMGTVVDPFGHVWHLSTHVEDVAPEEMKRRMDAAMAEWAASQAASQPA